MSNQKDKNIHPDNKRKPHHYLKLVINNQEPNKKPVVKPTLKGSRPQDLDFGQW